MKTKRQHHNPFKYARSISIAWLLLCTPSISLGWGAGGHMMTAHIAFSRLNPKAKAKVAELLLIEIPPADVPKSTDFVSASHWADDVRSNSQFDFLKPLHFIDKPFSLDGTALPEIEEENIVKALKDNVEILKTSTDKNAQARALRLVIHFVGDIHQPLHCTTKVSGAFPDGDQGGNKFNIKIMKGGKLKVEKLHSYWDGGISTFPPSGPPPKFIPPPLKSIAPAASLAKKGNPASDPALKLDDPFNFEAWADESFQLGQDVVYKGIRSGRRPSANYNARALKVARKRVAWGGYRLAALLNSIWPE